MFGPLTGRRLYFHVQSITDSLEIPHVQFDWFNSWIRTDPRSTPIINIFPSSSGNNNNDNNNNSDNNNNDNKFDYHHHYGEDTSAAPSASTYNSGAHQLSINLYPNGQQLSRAYLDLVIAWQWKSFVILYESDEGKWMTLMNE